jgi:hypothetical protein
MSNIWFFSSLEPDLFSMICQLQLNISAAFVQSPTQSILHFQALLLTATSVTTEAESTRTAAEATEAAVKEGRGVAPEAATGLAGRRLALVRAVADPSLLKRLN